MFTEPFSSNEVMAMWLSSGGSEQMPVSNRAQLLRYGTFCRLSTAPEFGGYCGMVPVDWWLDEECATSSSRRWVPFGGLRFDRLYATIVYVGVCLPRWCGGMHYRSNADARTMRLPQEAHRGGHTMMDKEARKERRRQLELARLIAQKDLPEKRFLGQYIGEKLRLQQAAKRAAMKEDLFKPT